MTFSFVQNQTNQQDRIVYGQSSSAKMYMGQNFAHIYYSFMQFLDVMLGKGIPLKHIKYEAFFKFTDVFDKVEEISRDEIIKADENALKIVMAIARRKIPNQQTAP